MLSYATKTRLVKYISYQILAERENFESTPDPTVPTQFQRKRLYPIDRNHSHHFILAQSMNGIILDC